jgi:hypothetical protein
LQLLWFTFLKAIANVVLSNTGWKQVGFKSTEKKEGQGETLIAGMANFAANMRNAMQHHKNKSGNPRNSMFSKSRGNPSLKNNKDALLAGETWVHGADMQGIQCTLEGRGCLPVFRNHAEAACLRSEIMQRLLSSMMQEVVQKEGRGCWLPGPR